MCAAPDRRGQFRDMPSRIADQSGPLQLERRFCHAFASHAEHVGDQFLLSSASSGSHRRRRPRERAPAPRSTVVGKSNCRGHAAAAACRARRCRSAEAVPCRRSISSIKSSITATLVADWPRSRAAGDGCVLHARALRRRNAMWGSSMRGLTKPSSTSTRTNSTSVPQAAANALISSAWSSVRHTPTAIGEAFVRLRLQWRHAGRRRDPWPSGGTRRGPCRCSPAAAPVRASRRDLPGVLPGMPRPRNRNLRPV